jgi:non-homologous end joining protein Ku
VPSLAAVHYRTDLAIRRGSGSRSNSSRPKDEKVPKDMLELATHIVETKAGHFNPDKFEDRYEDALKDLIKKKQDSNQHTL